MAKQPEDPTQREDRSRRRQLTVVSSTGSRQRFLRGMITHDLVQRGLEFERAFATAESIRERLSSRDEVTTAEIRDLILEELRGFLGPEIPPHLVEPVRTATGPAVIQHGRRLPFSRGLLARSIHAAGIELDRAYQLVTALLAEMQREGLRELRREELVRRVSELIERSEGAEAGRRYRLVRRIHRLPRPLVIYVGGASGTGKSTLSLELGPLLRIYRINATDTIRQMMRMVFSPRVLPALHSSSFEAAAAYLPGVDDEPPERAAAGHAQRLIATFEEQASRVLVGVRAVVERAIAENMSILVEGVHLYPPLVPFADLEGAVYQVPLVLGTLDDEAHRSRFLMRARLGGRRAERYLENFASIRLVHDFILQQAEAHEVPMVDTSDGDPPVVQTLHLVTGLLERQVPVLDRAVQAAAGPAAPTLMVVIDGLADRPVRALGGRTPLQAARTPTLDRLAREGQSGLADPVAPGVVPDTASGSLALFGQSPIAMKRGPVEALGSGLRLRPGDVALRGNFATLDAAGSVADRRAGRIRAEAAELAEALDRLPLPGSLAEEVEIRVRVTTEHRLALALRGEGLSSAIEGSDPGDAAMPSPPLIPRPVDPRDERAVHTARIVALFEQEARRLLEAHPANLRRAAAELPVANAVLTRGAGRVHRLVPLEEAGFPLRLACVAGDHTILGLAHWLGAETISSPRMTASLDTDLDVKFEAALEALRRNDLVIVHVKGADIASHDRRPDLKVAFLEAVDRQLAKLLEQHAGPLRVAVASDHATLSESGQHGADPLPVLIWGDGIEPDEVQSYDERSAGRGRLHRFPLQLLLGRLYDLS